MYVEDTKIFQALRTIEDAKELQSDLNLLVAWSEENHLPFNVEKYER